MDQLESLKLADGFPDVAANGRSHNLKRLDDAVGVDDEAAAVFYAFLFVIHSVQPADCTALVREHGEGDSFAGHLGKFIVIPDLVDKNAVYADGKNFNADFFKLVVFFSNC